MVDLTRDHGASAGGLHELAHPPHRPGADDAERVLRAVLEVRALDERVVVGDVDGRRTGPVPGLGSRDDELAMLRVTLHEQEISPGDAQRRLDDRLGIASQLGRPEGHLARLHGRDRS